MEFLDHSGHIFSLQSYDTKPIGYEYDENPYIFWINDTKDNQEISVNNYYVRSINVLFNIENNLYSDNIPLDDLLNIEIFMDSKIFGFIPANILQKTIQSQDINSIFTNYYNVNNTNIVQYLTNNSLDEEHNDDIICIRINEDNKHYILIPIYVIGLAKEEGTWTTNVMIHISYKNNDIEHVWCPITIGGVFVEQYESLIIHGKNMGIDLPHDILKAINGTSFFNDKFDEALYNEKIKEYLINYVGIKAEKGNYNSIKQSVDWFGYGSRVNISKLIQTDNEFKNQYIRDYFDINIDLLKSFKDFINTQYVSLNMKLNNETGEHYEQELSKDKELSKDIKFWGEGLPILEGLLNKKSVVYTNEFLKSEKYGYLSAYYLYTFNELGLKLAAMKYYLEKYFFPIFIKIKSFSLEYKVYQNDIKFVSKTNTIEHAGIVTTFGDKDEIKFDDSNIYYFTHQRRYVDNNLNEFIINSSLYNLDPNIDEEKQLIDNYYENNDNQWYLISDTCVSVPIIFLENKYYNCKLFLFEEIADKYNLIYESKFDFIQNDEEQNLYLKYNSFVFYPKIISQLQHSKSIYNCVNKNYKLCLLVNNKWYIKEFMIKTSEFIIDVGTIKYDYFFNDINYLWAKYKNIVGEINFDSDLLENDNYPKIIFKFNNDPEGTNEVNITQLITNFDFFDNPSRYMSNFRQIKDITNDKVIFNYYMHDTDFINVNNLNFGYDLNITTKNENDEEVLTNQYKELLNSYKETVNINNNIKYMNHIVLYDLYVDVVSKTEIKIFPNVVSTRVEGLLFTKSATSPDEKSYIRITGIPYSNEINTTEIDYYLLDNNIDDYGHNNNYDGLTKYGLYETNVYSFFLKVNDDYSIKLESDTQPYSYIEYKYKLGGENACIIFKSFNGFEHYINSEIVYNNIEEEIIFKDNEYWLNENTKLRYKASFVEYNAEENKYVQSLVTLEEYLENPENYYLKIEFEYSEYKQVLNYIGYISTNYGVDNGIINDEISYSNLSISDDNLYGTCTLSINGELIDNVSLVNTKYYKYFVKEGEAYPSNPSFYWYSIDENDSLEEISSKLNELIGSFESDENNLNDDFVNIKYNNVLCKDLSNMPGLYNLSYTYKNIDNQNYSQFVVNINGEDKDIQAGNDGFDFEVKENDKVYIYIRVKTSSIREIDEELCPILYKIETNYIKKKYNKTDNAIDLYKSFFNNAYSIIYRNEEDNTLINIWESNINQGLPNMFYDMYLMHDKEYWYIIYISKYTIDDLMLNYKDFNKFEKEINYNTNDHKYILKFVKSDNRFLINRMKFVSANGINQFDKNELIAIRIVNNSMLPLETITNTKWEITPLSVGCDKNIKINGITNLAILSIPNYDNEYKPGYYNINVNYSTTFKHANYKNLNTKILIK